MLIFLSQREFCKHGSIIVGPAPYCCINTRSCPCLHTTTWREKKEHEPTCPDLLKEAMNYNIHDEKRRTFQPEIIMYGLVQLDDDLVSSGFFFFLLESRLEVDVEA